MNKLKNYRRLLALLLIGLLIYSCSEDVNDTLTSESDQNFISEKFVKDVSNNFLFKNEKYNSLKKLAIVDFPAPIPPVKPTTIISQV